MRIWRLAVFGGLLILFWVSIGRAAVGINQQFYYQGVLKNSSGSVVSNGSYDVVFKLYTASSGGSAIWTGTHTGANGNAVTVTSGLFAVLLGSGSGNSLYSVDFNQDELWLGVTVGSDAEMTTRQRVGAAVYAFNADELDGVGFASASTLANGDLLAINSSGAIAATTSPTIGYFNATSTTATSTIAHGLTVDTTTLVVDAGGNRVGIGTTDPRGSLDLNMTSTITSGNDTAIWDTVNLAPTSNSSGSHIGLRILAQPRTAISYSGTIAAGRIESAGLSGINATSTGTTGHSGMLGLSVVNDAVDMDVSRLVGIWLDALNIGGVTGAGSCTSCIALDIDGSDVTTGTMTTAIGIQIGELNDGTTANWDILFNSQTPEIGIDNGGTLTFKDSSGNSLMSLADAGTEADLTLTGDLLMTDNDIIGLSTADARIEFDDQTTDEVNILSANVGIGTNAPGATLDVDPANLSGASAETIQYRSSAQSITLAAGPALSDWRQNQFIAPTISGTAGAPVETITNAATVYIDAAVTPSGAQMSITNPYTLWVDAGTTRLDGSLGVASSSPWRTLSVDGTVALNGLTSSGTGNAVCITTGKDITDAGGASCTPSSERFKQDMAALAEGFGLDLIRQLRPVSFDYQAGAYSPEDEPGGYGFIAEEVEKVDRRLVDYGYDGRPLTLHFEKITGLLVDAVQSLADRLDGWTRKFTTKELCLEDVCVTKEELRILLERAGIESADTKDSGAVTAGAATIEIEPTISISPEVSPEDEVETAAPALSWLWQWLRW